jgi:Protein Family FAM60A
VLLVKRFKRLPPGSTRHWGHVVDARTGPGLKSMTKFKKRKEEQEAGIKTSESVTERFSKLFKKTKKKEKSYKKETSSIGGSSDDSPPSPAESNHSDEFEDPIFNKKFFNYATRSNQKRQKAVIKQRRKRKNPKPTKNLSWPANHFNLFADVVNDEQWRQRMTCCGLVYECAELQAIIVDESSFKPCLQHRAPVKDELQVESPTITKTSISEAGQPLQNPPTAIKKHQLFLKRHEHPSITPCDNVISSSLMENSNKNKTELMNSEDLMKPFDKLRRISDKIGKFQHPRDTHENPSKPFSSSGLTDDANNAPIINENAFVSKDNGEKYLHKLNPESVKISKPSLLFSNPMSTSLKFKLANIVKCGTMGNDNSSDSGYEEVQDGSKLIIPQMPPPDVMQSL